MHRLTAKNLEGLDSDTRLLFGWVYTLGSCKQVWPHSYGQRKAATWGEKLLQVQHNKQHLFARRTSRGVLLGSWVGWGELFRPSFLDLTFLDLTKAAASQVPSLSQAFTECQNKALDCFEEDAAGSRSRFVVWPPFAIAMTHDLRLSKRSLDKAEGLQSIFGPVLDLSMCLESFQEIVATHVCSSQTWRYLQSHGFSSCRNRWSMSELVHWLGAISFARRRAA